MEEAKTISASFFLMESLSCGCKSQEGVAGRPLSLLPELSPSLQLPDPKLVFIPWAL